MLAMAGLWLGLLGWAHERGGLLALERRWFGAHLADAASRTAVSGGGGI